MLKDTEKWRELHPRERLVLFGVSHTMGKNGGGPVGFEELERITGIPTSQLFWDLHNLAGWQLVELTRHPGDHIPSLVTLAGEAADSPLMPGEVIASSFKKGGRMGKRKPRKTSVVRPR